MYYNHRNCNLRFNNKEILAINAELNTRANIQPIWQPHSKDNVGYAPDAQVQSLSFSYYLTGNDPILPYIQNDLDTCTGDFGGLYFETGYLVSYSLNASPNAPIVANANILFFDRIKGNFNPSVSNSQNVPILSYNNVQIIKNSTQENLSNIRSLDYSYTKDLRPVFNICDLTGQDFIGPSAYINGPKEVRINVITDDLNTDLGIFGKTGVGCKIFFNHPNLAGNVDSVTCSGVITEKVLSFSENDSLIKSVSIISNSVTNAPQITSVLPLTGIPGETVTIQGSSLGDIHTVYFGDSLGGMHSFTSQSDTQIQGLLPYDALSGNIQLFGPNKTVTYAGYSITYPSIIINDVIPRTGHRFPSAQWNFMITGDNFDRVSKIVIGETESNKFVVSDRKSIKVSIWGENLRTDTLKVVSALRNKSGVSNDAIYFQPLVTGITPKSGFLAELITISGYNFSDISAVHFNGCPANFTVSNPRLITAQVPSGNSWGLIKVINSTGQYHESNETFTPYTIVTGITPLSGSSGNVRISGLFNSGIMNTTGEQRFRIRFNEIEHTALYGGPTLIISEGLPSGGNISGPIRIGRIDGGWFDSPYEFQFIGKPFASYLVNSSHVSETRSATLRVISGKLLKGRADGSYLNNVTSVFFSGMSGINTHRRF
jgi:hypothetical protein